MGGYWRGQGTSRVLLGTMWPINYKITLRESLGIAECRVEGSNDHNYRLLCSKDRC